MDDIKLIIDDKHLKKIIVFTNKNKQVVLYEGSAYPLKGVFSLTSTKLLARLEEVLNPTPSE